MCQYNPEKRDTIDQIVTKVNEQIRHLKYSNQPQIIHSHLEEEEKKTVLGNLYIVNTEITEEEEGKT